MMDDIYSDLENFNDVNIVEELKNENKELKFKLEEYSGAMHQLQKDFDKLSVEYKKLEKNYSSLLKTARAEIERKTETIKSLNLEKDTLVIKALQNGKNILQNRRSYFKDTQQSKKNTENTNSCLKEVKKIIKAECLDNQLHVNRQPSVETVSSIPADCHSVHSENKTAKTDNKTPNDRCVMGRDERDKAYTKDNVQERPSVRKVMNRRKSIPNFGDSEPTFSSDDDSRKTNLEQQQGDLPQAGEDVRHSERHYEHQDYVAPESFDNYQPPQSSYRNRGNRHDFERQRNYECYDKSRRYYSPDNHHRNGKEFSENYNQRDHRDKGRLERSPPSDRYNRSKSRDRRHNYERENYRDYGRHSYHNSNHLGAKNKSRFELEGPSSKRPKVDSYCRQSIERNFNKEKERGMSERHTSMKPQEPLEPSSCQSPDYINIDSNVHHLVKEVKHTALTPHPDTGLLSNKYVLESNSKKPFLATAAGSNKDIVPIGNATWGEDKRKPFDKFHPNEADLVSEIYMNLDNFGKSPSIESGELQSLDEDHYATNYCNIPDQVQENVKSSVHRNHPIISHFSPTKEKEQKFINKYKIPHLKMQNVTEESSNTQEQQDVSNKKLNAFVKDFKVIVEGKHLSEKCSETHSTSIANVNVDNNKPESVLQKLMNEKMLSENSNPTKCRKSNKLVNISTIEGDLELSDETNDNMDLPKKDTSQNTVKDGKNEYPTKKEDDTSLEKPTNKSDGKVKKSKDTRKSSHSKKEHVKEKTRDSSRKRKNKKQTDQESSKVKDDSPETKRSKDKGNKVSSSNQTKNKFTELFGDSNSLITPDDLGVPNVITDKYEPEFENTQNAVDLSVEDMARKSAEKINADEKSKQMPDDTTIANSENHDSNENENYKSNSSTNLIYENAIADTNSSNIVKTVIISTGVQPQHISKDIDGVFPPNINGDSDIKKSELSTVKANVTSTSYKLITTKESQIVKDSTIINESINTKENVDKTDISINNINLNTNTSEDKIESDIPDVRIFVRRRKKITKKST